jgi:nucleotide-binding universal stress UspA family protein
MKKQPRAMGAIVFATDFCKPAQRAFGYALAVAKALDRPLVILHALKGVDDLAVSVSLGDRSLNSMKTTALLQLGRLARLTQDEGIEAEPLLQVGHPASCILEMISDSGAQVVVMGTHGRTGWDRLQLGSTAESVIRQASCPVMTVRGAVAGDATRTSSHVHVRRLLVATDFSVGARAAVRVGTALAQRVQGKIMVLHVDEASEPTGTRQQDVGRASRASSRRSSSFGRLKKLVSTPKARAVAAEGRCERGRPIEVILEQAAQWAADVIVIGTRGGGGLPHLLLGGLAEQLVRRAGCPVLSINSSAARVRF